MRSGANSPTAASASSPARSGASQTVQSDGDIYGVRVDAQGQQIDAMLAAVADADWRERFPGLTRYGAEEWFDYSAEDVVLDS